MPNEVGGKSFSATGKGPEQVAAYRVQRAKLTFGPQKSIKLLKASSTLLGCLSLHLFDSFISFSFYTEN